MFGDNSTGRSRDVMREVYANRDALQASIAAQLASNHGRSWIYLSDQDRAEYLLDAAALIDQGMTPYWENADPGVSISPEIEAEVFEFDRAMSWFMDYLDARHPNWQATGVYPSSHIELADPRDWDAWVSIAVSVSEAAKIVWSQRFEERTGEPTPVGGPAALSPLPASAPAAARVRNERLAAAIGAVLAHRHGRRWMDLPADARAAYLSDAKSLIAAGLTYTGG